MSLEITGLKKVITFKPKGGREIELPYPDGMTPAEAGAFYSKTYPELTTAKVTGPEIKDNLATYEFSTAVGTKG